MKFSPTQARVVTMALTTLVMTFAVSLSMSVASRTLDAGFLAFWLRNWAVAYTVACPTALLAQPPIARWVRARTRGPGA